MHNSAHCSSIHNHQDMGAATCPLIDKWIKKSGTYMKWNITQPPENKILPCTTSQMDPERSMISEILYDFSYMQNFKKQTTKQQQAHRYRK